MRRSVVVKAGVERSFAASTDNIGRRGAVSPHAEAAKSSGLR